MITREQDCERKKKVKKLILVLEGKFLQFYFVHDPAKHVVGPKSESTILIRWFWDNHWPLQVCCLCLETVGFIFFYTRISTGNTYLDRNHSFRRET